MTWSTREIADLAGTSLRSVRHYHDVGLLPEPERRSNGYKQYGVTHLIRLLRITRLVELGFGLAQIAELGDRDEHPEEALRALDADLVAQIERLQQVREEVAAMLEQRLPTDLPAEFAVVGKAAALSEPDRRFAAVMGRLLPAEQRSLYAELLSDDVRSASDDDFDALPPDADEAARDDLARRMLADLQLLRARFPGLDTLGSQNPHRYRRTVEQVSAEVFHPAQLDVLRRLRTLGRAERATAARPDAAPGTPPPPGTSS
ncbi:MerR family transcriptional regulator [Actinomycetospora sp. NBRC 106378]|uniref:MerR family transcriptional regulator n=1 Tax=Actinomycetospora sp. NBRC 106378 TaxID=3032208 RepID=UPI0024A09889|nr:MerR family transcriptional regulator [Actinomycetospora sp. NBRC 106378]GLZ52011.1 transcriptional regulator, MerR family protein [Actinomycetospora sp. NBRC 106378]